MRVVGKGDHSQQPEQSHGETAGGNVIESLCFYCKQPGHVLRIFTRVPRGDPYRSAKDPVVNECPHFGSQNKKFGQLHAFITVNR